MDLLGDSDESVAVAALGSIGTQRVDANRLNELTTFVETRGASGALNDASVRPASRTTRG